MRSAALVGVVLVALGVATLASPMVTSGLAAVWRRVPLPRVYDRAFEVMLAIGLLVRWRRLDLGDLKTIGFRHDGWAAALRRGVGVGLIGVAVGLLLAGAAGGVVPVLRFSVGKTIWKALLGLAAAGVVGVGEEILFRGALLRRFRLDLGDRVGVIVTTAIYAIVHVLRTRGGGDLSGPWGGVARTLGLFAPLADAANWPSLLGLTLLGTLLAVARLQSGNLWCSIGIHAASRASKKRVRSGHKRCRSRWLQTMSACSSA